ncbi:hypothetical protein N7539_004245 [Penicillium diatomitis]|uniref:FAM192A/Fyv6 N-terminal domain-containing protein n=1 Tax=Penicillium diatomitis TaxID=2819901 RepID=A0A9X0BY25_9EURO|nr:uncharacterized protein N7539_004245 [Penicillium diatomitis]KAJ5489355.1 hypothetical protein N7539_004245 [Penicillium diatomitis]
MSSGFVSAGTNEEPVERDDAWVRVQKELEEERRRKAEIGQQKDGKSLYEVLQQNKMAKQEEHEEKMRLKNQFRALDEDEVEFLDSVLESTRAQEEAVKKETADQLEAFRKQREEAEKAAMGHTSSEVTPAAAEEEDWAISSKKRRRDKGKDSLLPGKRRKSSAVDEVESPTPQSQKPQGKDKSSPAIAVAKKDTPARKPAEPAAPSTAGPGLPKKEPPKPSQASPPALGLVGYGSDSDSD